MVKQVKCKACGKPIAVGEVFIKIKRARFAVSLQGTVVEHTMGLRVYFHEECFKK